MFIVIIHYISVKDKDYAFDIHYGPFPTYNMAFDWLANTGNRYDRVNDMFRWSSRIVHIEKPL